MTLNQTITKLKSIVTSHKLINSYYFGDIVNWTEFENVIYTSCVLTLSDAVYLSNTTQFNFSFWISDRLLPDNSNRDAVLSDTLQILNDLVAQINDSSIAWFPELDNKAVTFFEDDRGNDNSDSVAGVKYDFSIRVATPKDICNTGLVEAVILPASQEFGTMTLNQNVAQLRSIITAHRQVKSFYFGDIVNWTELQAMKYTSVVLTLNDAARLKTVTQLNFSLWISDRLLTDQSNRNDVLSDTLQILQDLISQINNIEIFWFPQVDEKAITFFEDERNNDNADVVAGVKYDFSLSIRTPLNLCVVPTRGDEEEQIRNGILREDGLFILGEDGTTIITE
jgi:hypothetical protein